MCELSQISLLITYFIIQAVEINLPGWKTKPN